MNNEILQWCIIIYFSACLSITNSYVVYEHRALAGVPGATYTADTLDWKQSSCLQVTVTFLVLSVMHGLKIICMSYVYLNGYINTRFMYPRAINKIIPYQLFRKSAWQ